MRYLLLHAMFYNTENLRILNTRPHIHEPFSYKFLFGTAAMIAYCFVEISIHPVMSDDLAPFEHVVEGGTKAFLAFTEVFLRSFALGNIKGKRENLLIRTRQYRIRKKYRDTRSVTSYILLFIGCADPAFP